MTGMDVIRDLIRDVEDFPEPGIVYKDITPLLSDPYAFEAAIDAMAAPWLGAEPGTEITKVAGIESRGFIFGVAIAQRLSALGSYRSASRGSCPRRPSRRTTAGSTAQIR